MIKINLLDSVTERQAGMSVAVEKKVSSPVTRFVLMSIAVFALFVVVAGWDFIGSRWAKAAAETELAEQQKIAKELEAVMKEQKELEQKIKNVDLRIAAIKKLRSSQAGPSAVLSSISERLISSPGIYISSIQQQGDQLTVKGSSPKESSVTQFGRSLEFSSGLFTNLSIETQRKEIGSQKISATSDAKTPGKQVIEFTIRCAYTPEKASSPDSGVIASNASGSSAKEENKKPVSGK